MCKVLLILLVLIFIFIFFLGGACVERFAGFSLQLRLHLGASFRHLGFRALQLPGLNSPHSTSGRSRRVNFPVFQQCNRSVTMVQ